MKKRIFIILGLVVVIILWALFMNTRSQQAGSNQHIQNPNQTVLYTCAEGKQFTAGFSEQQVVVTFLNGDAYTLEQNNSSGMPPHYANEGNQVALTTLENGGAYLEQNGECTYIECQQYQAGNTAPITLSQLEWYDFVSSPLSVVGEAPGTWFFEGSFPVELTDWDGRIIAEGIAEAQSDWMTEDQVPFTATLTFEKPQYGSRGTLILKKDNPSGLLENDDSREVTIFFK